VAVDVERDKKLRLQEEQASLNSNFIKIKKNNFDISILKEVQLKSEQTPTTMEMAMETVKKEEQLEIRDFRQLFTSLVQSPRSKARRELQESK
jgi:hypothetical protein